MKIAIRLDDINPCMNYEKFCQVKKILDTYKICPLIGVVPDNQDLKIGAWEEIENYNELLCSLRENGWIIAMHGVTHKYQNNKSEFCGLSYEKQFEMLKRGKEKLEKEIKEQVSVFFAPSNNHDENTLLALKNLGFTHISYGQNDNIFEGGASLTFIPMSSGIREVNRLLKFQRNHLGVTTLVIHPNTVTEKLLKRYEKLLKAAYKKGEIVNYGDLLSEKIYAKNVKWIKKEQRINTVEEFLSKTKSIVCRRG